MGRAGSSGGVNYLKGFEKVMAELNVQINAIENRSMAGEIKAVAFIRTETEATPPLTPVDYGNLRASWFTVTAKRKVAGKGEGAFKGPQAGTIAEQCAANIQQAQSEIEAMDSKTKKHLMFGYSANYSGYVHEMEGATFQRPGAGPKWLEAHVKGSSNKILQIIREDAQIKR